MWTRGNLTEPNFIALNKQFYTKIPQPPSAVVTLFAIRFASSSAAGVMG